MRTPDFLIFARWTAPVEPPGVVLEDHVLGVRNGLIAGLLPRAEAEGPHLSKEFVRAGTELALVEMVRSGTTCFADMYFFPETGLETALQRRVRVAAGLPMVDFPTAWAADRKQSLRKNEEVYLRYRDQPGISFTIAPHAPYTVDDAGLELCADLSAKRGLPVHIHLHETATEITDSIRQHGRRPLARLDELGLINERLMAVHATQLEAEEIALLAERGSAVAHCPQSNLKLASGFCPVQALLEAGVTVALGTDSTDSNNDLDMLAEMQTAALLAKGVAGNAEAVSATQALEMATLAGARALGLDAEIGSLRVGKSADIVALDLTAANNQPLYDPLAQLVYTCNASQVSDVWVRGRELLQDGQLEWGDEDRILEQARAWGRKIGGGAPAHAPQSETQ